METVPEFSSVGHSVRCVLVVAALVSSSSATSLAAQQPPDVELFFQAASREKEEAEAALAKIGQAWKDGYASMLIDIVRFLPNSRRTGHEPD